MKYTIFSIDHWQLDSVPSAFRKYFMSQEPEGKLVACEGRYEGQPEVSYICLTSDFKRIVEGTEWVKNQNSVLEVSGCGCMYTDEVKMSSGVRSYGVRSYLGMMKEVSYEEAMAKGSFTYRPDLNVYWVAS